MCSFRGTCPQETAVIISTGGGSTRGVTIGGRVETETIGDVGR